MKLNSYINKTWIFGKKNVVDIKSCLNVCCPGSVSTQLGNFENVEFLIELQKPSTLCNAYIFFSWLELVNRYNKDDHNGGNYFGNKNICSHFWLHIHRKKYFLKIYATWIKKLKKRFWIKSKENLQDFKEMGFNFNLVLWSFRLKTLCLKFCILNLVTKYLILVYTSLI